MKPVLTKKQYLDLMRMMKDTIVAAGEFVGTPEYDKKLKEKKFERYTDCLDTFEDYLRFLSEEAAPAIQPPRAAP